MLHILSVDGKLEWEANGTFYLGEHPTWGRVFANKYFCVEKHSVERVGPIKRMYNVYKKCFELKTYM
jgi:hypothetical protein